MKRYDIAYRINQWHMWSLLQNICVENNFNWFLVFVFSFPFFSHFLSLLLFQFAPFFIPPNNNNNNDTSRDNIFPFCVIWKPNKAIWNPQMAIQLYFAKGTYKVGKNTHSHARTHWEYCVIDADVIHVLIKKHPNGTYCRQRFTQKKWWYCHRNVNIEVKSRRIESVTCHRRILLTYNFTLFDPVCTWNCDLVNATHTMSHTCILFSRSSAIFFYSFWPFHHDDTRVVKVHQLTIIYTRIVRT